MSSPSAPIGGMGYSHTAANQPTAGGYGLYGASQAAAAMSPFVGGQAAGAYSPLPGGMNTAGGGGASPSPPYGGGMASPSHNPAMSIGGMNTPYQTMGGGGGGQYVPYGGNARPGYMASPVIGQMPPTAGGGPTPGYQQPKDSNE
jgi:hypothetical protein